MADGRDGVRVRAPARLHLGLIDMNGGLGRSFGSIGLAVDRPAFTVELRPAARLTVDGPEAARAARYLSEAAETLGVSDAVALRVVEAMPAHAGFGSGTQLALAVAAGLARLRGVPVDLRALGAELDRGARSGIGVAAFLDGGFLVDGGRKPGGGVPPLIARLPFPEDWRLLLMLETAAEGVHGPEEVAAFRDLPVFPSDAAAHLCRVILMRLLPGLAEHDLAAVGSALTEIQASVGDHFAPAQGGSRFASAAVSEALALAAAAGAAGVGQSSWGPTGFALVGSDAEALALRDHLVRNCHTAERLNFMVATGRNRGATVETVK
ncbi:beta-ribofuranosylaminobenzene 5'-phosphate synthase family protein [Chthonobacter rhizosphaerae]|uniref:beta-ribofuranosylaminobenzene 5'-phosphate synthase family protein n=1 Tax=Chthonobacter rhizosphaerae TaxID=2735553 RepID=UPI0015EF9802|nr:beta-ribofuranosylaminobenzene 5'-phosphate synthase family protein [Chthonobacter rhizosphaerae]